MHHMTAKKIQRLYAAAATAAPEAAEKIAVEIDAIEAEHGICIRIAKKEVKVDTIESVKAEIAAAESEYAKASALAKSRCKIDKVVNEGGDGYSQGEDMLAAAGNDYLKTMKALNEKMFALVWTLEETKKRRDEWREFAKKAEQLGNAWFRKNAINPEIWIAKNVGWTTVAKNCAKMSELRAAIKVHGL